LSAAFLNLERDAATDWTLRYEALRTIPPWRQAATTAVSRMRTVPSRGRMGTHPTGGGNRHGDHAMNQITDTTTFALLGGEAGFHPIEERLRTNVRATI
jgi:hypothetical protein